jgi:hypothetical protein
VEQHPIAAELPPVAHESRRERRKRSSEERRRRKHGDEGERVLDGDEGETLIGQGLVERGVERRVEAERHRHQERGERGAELDGAIQEERP